jgi:hypothetical protein
MIVYVTSALGCQFILNEQTKWMKCLMNKAFLQPVLREVPQLVTRGEGSTRAIIVPF